MQLWCFNIAVLCKVSCIVIYNAFLPTHNQYNIQVPSGGMVYFRTDIPPKYSPGSWLNQICYNGYIQVLCFLYRKFRKYVTHYCFGMAAKAVIQCGGQSFHHQLKSVKYTSMTIIVQITSSMYVWLYFLLTPTEWQCSERVFRWWVMEWDRLWLPQKWVAWQYGL